ncbi:helix-turn-helix domain-containing protein [Isoalcanivorax indicus]|uniref:helix-turn-helix domain-containing protein n=1 Tax=Isoalcanivorax indicus TaxID=2202653 RepID=UPI003CCC6A3C
MQLEVAIELLMEPGLRVEDAGRRLGYSESQSFIRWFRRQTGDTPSRYRSRHRLT